MIKLNQEKLYTVAEVAKYLKVHEITVRRHLESGKLKGYKAGRQWRISQTAIDNYLKGE